MVINNPYKEKVEEHSHIFSSWKDSYWHKWKWKKYFWNTNPLYLEIWTGLGNFFSKEVQKNPHINYIWMEIKYKRLFVTAEKALWNLNNYASNNIQYKWILKKLERANSSSLIWNNWWNTQDIKGNTVKSNKQASNFTLIKDFWENISEIFSEWELYESYIFFPDPWAKKKRQMKHRLLQESFLTNLYICTRKWWKAIIKTDHEWYFTFILEEIKNTPWQIVKESWDYENELEFQNAETTEFQQLFRGQKMNIHYIELQK